jgi:hypothetical protein
MKLKKTKIPFRPSYELASIRDPSELAEEDYDFIKKLMQEGKEDEVRDFVNSRLLNNELAYTHSSKNPDQGYEAGMSTKQYVHDIIGKHILENNPTVSKSLQMGDLEKGAQELANTLHPNYKSYREKAHEKGPLLNKIRKAIHGGYNSDIAAMDQMPEGVNALGYFSPYKGIRMSPYQSPKSYASTLKHEMDHSLDFIAESLSKDKDFIKEYPKYKNFKKDDFEDKAETGYVNPIIPNFKDYNFEKGEFESNYVRDPVDITEEVVGKHRYGRNHLFEELRKKLK